VPGEVCGRAGNAESAARRITGMKTQRDWSRAGRGAAAGVLSGAVAVWAYLIKARAPARPAAPRPPPQSPPEPNGATGYPSVTVT
jgi:hypothetical protein